MRHPNHHRTKESDEKILELIADVKVAMLTTIDDEGHLHSRPMQTLEPAKDFGGELWFFTGRSSGKVLSVAHDDRVNLAYSEPKDTRYLSVAGRAELVNDQAKMKELWNPAYKAWFPEGLEDPELSLLKVTIESAEYWDPVSSKLVQLIGFAKAVLTGQPYESGPGEHGRVNLQH